jgi:hypothetical protein
MIPTWLRWILSPLLTYRNTQQLAICKKIGVPIVKKRIEEYRNGGEARVSDLEQD